MILLRFWYNLGEFGVWSLDVYSFYRYGLFIFFLGIGLGWYYSPILNDVWTIIGKKRHPTPTLKIHFCPPGAEVMKHQYDPEAFQSGGLFWQMDFEGWKGPDKVGFMQALINKNNNLVCYYHWPNPKDKGTYLWTTIHLSPSVNQIVKPYGSYWSTEKDEAKALCMAGINACAFTFPDNSQPINPQNRM